MEQDWTGVKANGDVVVSLVQRSTSASTDQGSAVMDEKEARKRKSKRKRVSEPGDEAQTVGELHVLSNRLRRCSEYFDTCLSKEWAGADTETPVHLTLDVYTDVKYYRECFCRMHSSNCSWIRNVEQGLKLLQVASQISYFSLVEDCVRYLTSVPWSHKDETRIREFANSMFYPSDCAADLSARLGHPLSDTERYSLLCNLTESTVCGHFDDARGCPDSMMYGGQVEPNTSWEFFSAAFQKYRFGPCQTGVENVLKHVHAYVKKTILEAKEHSESNDDPGFFKVRWALDLLLQTGFATELVEYIAEESALSEMLKDVCYQWKLSWVETLYDVFQEVISGHLLLKTTTRYMLLQNWTWILVLGANSEDDELGRRICKLLNTVVLTFPLETQKEIFSDWVTYYRSETREVYDLNFVDLFAKWIANLQKKIGSLEPL